MRFDCIHCRKATTKPQSVKGAFLRMLTVVPRAVRETIAAKGKKVDDVKLFDWSDRNDYFYVEFDEPDSELLINFDGSVSF